MDGRRPARADPGRRAPGRRGRLAASPRADFFTEALPFPTGELEWPDAPCGLLQTSAGYAATARSARSRGWPVLEREGGHFASCVDPQGIARDLLALVDRM